MQWLIGGGVVLLLTALTVLFTASARLIRRDMNDRFHHVRLHLEDAANAVVKDLLDDHKQA